MQDNSNTFVAKTVIPHYIIDYSILYNHYILPIYLFLKQRTNIDKEIYFSYKSLLEFFNNDRFNQTHEKEILTAIIFLFKGVTVIQSNQSKELIINSFQLTSEDCILSKILNSITLEEDKQEETLTLVTNNQSNTLEKIIQLILEYLNNNNNILLYDVTKENMIGYILIKNSALSYILWYFKHQTNNFNKLTQKYELINEEQLKKLKTKYAVKEGKSKPTKISYITLINMYVYIYKLYMINQSFNQNTTVSMATLAKKLSASNTTIKLYTDILIDIGLINTTLGSFKDKQITIYHIVEFYEEKYQDINNFEVYRYSILIKSNFQQLLKCYQKKNTNPTQKIKRGRGRPKKVNNL